MDNGCREIRLAWLLTALAFCLLVLWSFIVPIFESPDEDAHWQYVRHLHDTHELPVYGPLFVEANSPPLYYALLAPLGAATDGPPHLAWIDAVLNEVVLPAAPRHYMNVPGDLSRYWVLRRARILTAAIAATTVLFTFLAGREATGRASTGLLAAACVAFLPQFSFRGMTISNDALVAALGAASLYGILKIARRGFTWKTGVWTTLAMSTAFLTKINAIFMPAVFAFVVLREPAPWRTRLQRLSVLGLGLALAAPWLIRNQQLYGDPLAVGAMTSAVNWLFHPKPITSPYFYTVFPLGLFFSFIGLFGWMNLVLPLWVYAGYLALGGLAIAGWWWRRPTDRDRTVFLALIAFAALTFAMVVRINLSFDQPQGRYLFPALAALAVLFAGGLERLPRWSPRAAVALAGALLVANVAIASLVVAPTYWPPPISRLSTARLPLDALQPSDLEDLGNDTFRITGPDPSLSASISESCLYNFLQFEISASGGAGRVLAGAASFGPNGAAPDAVHSFPFLWKADGVASAIRIPLFTHPEWGCSVTAIRIDPVDGAAGAVGSSFVLKQVELRGALP